MKKIIISILSLLLPLPILAQIASYDLNAPFGWCTCFDYQHAGFEINGGNGSSEKRTVTLKANGKDQSKDIRLAIENNEIVVLDGSAGDFRINHSFRIEFSKNKTIVGVNNARLCTEFFITPELSAMLDKAGVRKASTQGGTGGVLTNGTRVGEEREMLTRQTLINAGYEDPKVRDAGVMQLFGCQNIIVRNINFVGPGSIDVGGNDLLTLSRCQNIWVDHCSFTDGIDGNFDINQSSDCITVSWCKFGYTERAYDHMNTNLVGANDRDGKGENKLNVTFAHCMWGYRCNQRMPMARNGIIHLLNNYYNCAGNSVSINPRSESKFIVEGVSVAEGVKLFSQTKAAACSFDAGYYLNGFNEKSPVCNFGIRPTLPYEYKVEKADIVAENVEKYAGATLTDPLSF